MRLSAASINSSTLCARHPERRRSALRGETSAGSTQVRCVRRSRARPIPRPLTAVLILFALSLAASAQAVDTQRYDGNWWTTTSAEERTAFVTGSEECHTFDRKVVRKTRLSDEDYARAVDRYYQQNRRELATSVSLVMDKLNLASPIPQPRRSAKTAAAKLAPHGTLDGTWWRGAAGDEQLGFVEGYLSCRAQIRAARPLHFSRRALDYVQMTSTYYADDAKHEPEKLADVLVRFRDEPPKPAKR